MKLSDHITCFFGTIGTGAVEIYNEFSLQHELGVYLRANISPGFKVQFERPYKFFFGEEASRCVKKEIDITVFDQLAGGRRFAVELKFPQNGQYPEQMFSACKDIRFLEQLVERGFVGGMFVIAASDKLFFHGKATGPLYGGFRAGAPICGAVQKPTGQKHQVIELVGTYSIKWRDAGEKLRFAAVPVGDDVEV